MGKNNNPCMYCKGGKCSILGGRCEARNPAEECGYFEAADGEKKRTIQRNKARKQKEKDNWN